MSETIMSNIFALTLRPAINAVRVFLINAELRNTEYGLSQIAKQRKNDLIAEEELHKRQVHLISELRRLKGRK